MNIGKFIVIDGADYCGKKTQTQLLKERLTTLGHQVETIDFPRYTDNFFGKIIRNCIDGMYGEFAKIDPYLASIPYAGDRLESKPQLLEWLNAGKIVISDRYISANQLHQGGKIKDLIERKKYFDWLEHLEYGVFGIPKPDLIVYLDLPHALSLQLMNKNAADRGEVDMVEKDEKYQLNARESALAMLQDPSWVRIVCSEDEKTILDKEKIHEMIFKNCSTVL